MELFEQLEERIGALANKLETLSAENAVLKAKLDAYASLEEENHSLKEALAEEQQKNETALARVNAILQRLQELQK